MGAYSYCRCRGCDMPLGRATLSEVVDDNQYCSRGHRNPPNMTRDEALVELDERLAAIETRLGIER